MCAKPVCGEVHHDVLRQANVHGSAISGIVQPICQFSGILLHSFGCYCLFLQGMGFAQTQYVGGSAGGGVLGSAVCIASLSGTQGSIDVA